LWREEEAPASFARSQEGSGANKDLYKTKKKGREKKESRYSEKVFVYRRRGGIPTKRGKEVLEKKRLKKFVEGPISWIFGRKQYNMPDGEKEGGVFDSRECSEEEKRFFPTMERGDGGLNPRKEEIGNIEGKKGKGYVWEEDPALRGEATLFSSEGGGPTWPRTKKAGEDST